MITNAQIKKIKTLQRSCGLNDDCYRAILRNKAGVNSCKDLRSNRQIQTVVAHLSRLAERVDNKCSPQNISWKWEERPEGKQLLEKAQIISRRFERPSLEQFHYIFGLWWALRKAWRKDPEQKMEPSLNHFLASGRAGSHLKVATWQWLTPNIALHLIDILKARVAQNNKPRKSSR